MDRPVIRLRVADPDEFARRVADGLGVGAPDGARALELANAVLVIESRQAGSSGSIEVDGGASVAAADRPGAGAGAGASVVGLGWATVDLERAAAELGAATELGAAIDEADGSVPFPEDQVRSGRDAVLGARLRPIGRVGSLPFDTVLLEPVTEGRLAAALARDGEGPIVVYVRGDRGRAQSDAARTVRHIAGSRFGPWLVVFDATAAERRPGTIERVNEDTVAHASAPSIVLRRADGDDAVRIASLLTDEGYPVAPSDVAVRIERFAPPSAVVVAVADGEVLGFVAAHVMPRFEHHDAIVRILALVVDPGVRERGIGGLLIAEAERIGRESGAAFAEVTSGHHRPEARRLYESVGFDAAVTTYLRKRL